MWRYTGERFRIACFDAWVAPFVLPILYISPWTFAIAVAGLLTFGTLSLLGISPPVAYRSLRALVAGPGRPAVRQARQRWLA